jgi:hypothetical protein
MNKIAVGIDPGKKGFIAIFEGSMLTFFSIPTVGKELDIHGLKNILCTLAAKTQTNLVRVVTEDVHALFGSSAKGTFSFGYTCGVIEGILSTLNIPYTKVTPKKWQAEMHQGIPVQKKPSSTGKTEVKDVKLMSLMAAKRLFPEVDFRATERCKNPDDNKIDALLMAEYCRRKF